MYQLYGTDTFATRCHDVLGALAVDAAPNCLRQRGRSLGGSPRRQCDPRQAHSPAELVERRQAAAAHRGAAARGGPGRVVRERLGQGRPEDQQGAQLRAADARAHGAAGALPEDALAGRQPPRRAQAAAAEAGRPRERRAQQAQREDRAPAPQEGQPSGQGQAQRVRPVGRRVAAAAAGVAAAAARAFRRQVELLDLEFAPLALHSEASVAWCMAGERVHARQLTQRQGTLELQQLLR
ncbi:hypothetical protein ON010_g17419 [Phytophthora cinnamomi]|nr:hypothetical protein ON010_g17419 [Phytophthora cinnamomi]